MSEKKNLVMVKFGVGKQQFSFVTYASKGIALVEKVRIAAERGEKVWATYHFNFGGMQKSSKEDVKRAHAIINSVFARNFG